MMLTTIQLLLLFLWSCLCVTAQSSLAPVKTLSTVTIPSIIDERVQPANQTFIATLQSENKHSLLYSRITHDGIRRAHRKELQELIYSTKLSSSAYCRDVIPGGLWTCSVCETVPDITIVATFDTFLYDTNAAVLRSDIKKTIYVVFRGTNSVQNGATDVLLEPSQYSVAEARVHTGAYAGYLDVQKYLLPAVISEADQYPDYKIAYVGHSLGGAFALVGALDLYQRYQQITPSNLVIYTQGQPRTGNLHFAYYVASTGIPYIRGVHGHDLVPHIPGKSLGYVHAGVEYWVKFSFRSYYVVDVCERPIESNMCSETIHFGENIHQHLSYFGVSMGLCHEGSTKI